MLLAAALTVRGTRFGHVCIRLDSVRDAVVVDGQDPEEIETLPWPETAEWEAAVAASVLVGDGSGDEPLVGDDGRLYLERYYRYEERVAEMIAGRCAAPRRPLLAATDVMLQELLEPESRQYEAAALALTGNVAVDRRRPGDGQDVHDRRGAGGLGGERRGVPDGGAVRPDRQGGGPAR